MQHRVVRSYVVETHTRVSECPKRLCKSRERVVPVASWTGTLPRLHGCYCCCSLWPWQVARLLHTKALGSGERHTITSLKHCSFLLQVFSFSMAKPASSLDDVYEKVKIKSGLKVKYFKLQVIDSQNGDKDLTEYQIKTMLCKNLTRRKAYNGHFLI